jgi:hypothetical protein
MKTVKRHLEFLEIAFKFRLTVNLLGQMSCFSIQRFDYLTN